MKTRDEVYAVLVKLAGETLLLPNAAVIEVISAERLRPAAADAPAWLTGTVDYNGLVLPVLRFEVLNGGSASGDERRARLAVVQGISDRLQHGRYAVVCQGYPHLVTLNRTALTKEAGAPGDRADLVLSRVKIANTSALIPNLELIEAELAEQEDAPAAGI